VVEVKRLTAREHDLLALLRDEFPVAASRTELAHFLWNHAAALTSRMQELHGLSGSQADAALKGLAAKRGYIVVEFDQSASLADSADPLDVLAEAAPALLVAMGVRDRWIPPPPREVAEQLLSVKFIAAEVGGLDEVWEVATRSIGRTPAYWAQVFLRLRRRLSRFLGAQYPGLGMGEALQQYLKEGVQ